MRGALTKSGDTLLSGQTPKHHVVMLRRLTGQQYIVIYNLKNVNIATASAISCHQHASRALQALFILSSHIKLDAPSFASVVRHVAFAVVRQFVHFEHIPLGKQVAAEGVSHAELRITAPCHLKHIVAQTPERTAAVGQPAHYHLVANLQFIRQARFAEKHFALRCNRMSPLTEIPPPGCKNLQNRQIPRN